MQISQLIFFREIEVAMHKMIGNINQKIYFELEQSECVQPRINLLSHTKALIFPAQSSELKGWSEYKTYPDLRALFFDSLKLGRYAEYSAIQRDGVGGLIIPRENGKIVIPSILKVWERKARLELLEIQALEMIAGRLNKNQHVDLTHFDGIRQAYLRSYKEKVYSIQALDHFCAGRISDKKLFGGLGISKNFQKAIELVQKANENLVAPSIPPQQAVQEKVEKKYSPVRIIKNKLAFLFCTLDNKDPKKLNFAQSHEGPKV